MSSTYQAVAAMLDGTLPASEVEAFLRNSDALMFDAQHLAEARRAIMERAAPFRGIKGSIDVCGTGGDGLHMRNISTACAFVLAACGIPVIKHGNRAVSSRAGSSDVLSALGIPHDLPADFWEDCIQDLGIAFLFAPLFHPGLKALAPLRARIGKRTLFNVMGPLCNPGEPAYQLLGVYADRLRTPVAEALVMQGSEAAWVVHGETGEDEISVCGSSHVTCLKHGAISEFAMHPGDIAMPCYTLDNLHGGDADDNARAMLHVFEGEVPAYRDAVIFNAAAGLVIAGKCSELTIAASQAARAIDTGAARRVLTQLQASIDKYKNKS